MLFYIKDYRNRLHKIEFSSREALIEQITAIGVNLRTKYREKSLYDESNKTLLDRLQRLEEKFGAGVGDNLISELEHIQVIRDDLWNEINGMHLLISDIVPEQKLSVKHFLSIGYRFQLPEIYAFNLDELEGLLDSMIDFL